MPSDDIVRSNLVAKQQPSWRMLGLSATIFSMHVKPLLRNGYLSRPGLGSACDLGKNLTVTPESMDRK